MISQNENEESIISKKIKRYPFNGRSNYLIEQFSIIGYNYPTLEKLLYSKRNQDNLSSHIILDNNQTIDNKSKSGSSLNLQAFHLDEEPILLNNFSSDYSKSTLDFKVVKEMILPNNLTLYYSEDDPSNKTEKKDEDNDDFEVYEKDDIFDNPLLQIKTMVFSSNPQMENNTKKSSNGLSFRFYKKLKKKETLSKKIISFYIPTIFCIISEFPYYHSFAKLCYQIKKLYKIQTKDVPIEFIIYNIIKYSESPINGDVNLSIKPFLYPIKELEIEEQNQKEKFRQSQKIENKRFTKFSKLDTVINEIDEEEEKIVIDEKINSAIQQLEPFNDDSTDSKAPQVKRNFMKKNTEYIGSSKGINLFSRTFKTENLNDLESMKKIKTKVSEEKKNKLKIKLKKTKEPFPKIKFGILPGYPLIQYNLAKVLFHTFSPLEVIEIFFYTFLEKDVIIFSKNLQLLSLTIDSYLNFNFPLNDEKYYFFNASVSYENYFKSNSTFVGSAFTTLIGINSPYQPNYINGMSAKKLKEHLVVDLDEGKLYEKEDKSDNQNSEKNKNLFKFIKKSCKKEIKENNNQTILASEINILSYRLYNIYDQINLENIDCIENYSRKNKFGEFLDYDEDDDEKRTIKKTNFEIQDAFYRLIINLCIYFYSHLSMKTEGDDKDLKLKTKYTFQKSNEINVFFENDYITEGKYINEEVYFLEELKETMKYESFIYGFVQSYSPIDLYKIPLTFAEEFMSMIARKRVSLEKNIKFLKMFDKIYFNEKHQSIEIDFVPFYNKYYKEYKHYFDREIDENCENNEQNEELIKVKYKLDKKSNLKFLKYRDYELDNNLLMNYLFVINNLDKDEYQNLFYLSDFIQKNLPKDIQAIQIENIIEQYAMNYQFLSYDDICCSNIIMIFSLSLSFLIDLSFDYNSFLFTIFKDFIVFRKYFSYLMNMLYILFDKYSKKGDYHRANSYLLTYYISLNAIRSFKLVPNESLMNIIKKFSDIDTKKFNENLEKQDKNDRNSKINNNINLNEIKNDEVYVYYNFNKNEFFKEGSLMRIINSKEERKKNDSKDNKKKIVPKIRYQNKSFKIESLLHTQKFMLTELIKTYNKYVLDYNEDKIFYKLILDSCLNIFIYIRNSPKFSKISEIKEIIGVIFGIFLNKYNDIE